MRDNLRGSNPFYVGIDWCFSDKKGRQFASLFCLADNNCVFSQITN